MITTAGKAQTTQGDSSRATGDAILVARGLLPSTSLRALASGRGKLIQRQRHGRKAPPHGPSPTPAVMRVQTRVEAEELPPPAPPSQAESPPEPPRPPNTLQPDAPEGMVVGPEGSTNAVSEPRLPPATGAAIATEPDDDFEELIEKPATEIFLEEPSPSSATFRGWSRTSAGVVGLFRTLEPTLPHDNWVASEHLFLEAQYRRSQDFQVVISGLLAYRLYAPRDWEEPLVSAPSSALRSQFEASLREAYLRFSWPELDLTVGQQRIAWGNSDTFSPNDVLNAVDARDRSIIDAEILHIPTFSVRTDWAPGWAVFSVVLSPFFTPDRYDTYGSNWALIQPNAPPAYLRIASLAADNVDKTLQAGFQPLLSQTRLPSDFVTGASLGLAMRWSTASVNFSHYYHYGYDRLSLLHLDASLAEQLAAFDPDAPSNDATIGLINEIERSESSGADLFSATFVRRHHLGTDVQTAWGPFVLRGEVAFDSNRVFSDRVTLEGQALPSGKAVLGLEYHPGSDTVLILEGAYQRLFDIPAGFRPLGYATHTTSVTQVTLWSPGDFEAEIRAVVGLSPQSFVAQPELGWRAGSWSLRLGLLALFGEGGSLPDYFRRNGSVYVVARSTF